MTWSKAFGNTVTPLDQASETLQAHFRYPEDLFKVQRKILSRYHVQDPASFYNGQDFWTIPDDPTNRAVASPQPPYYLTLRMPGTTDTEVLADDDVRAEEPPDPGRVHVGGLCPRADVRHDPGARSCPRNTTVPGPTQVQNNFESEPAIAEQLTLLRRGGAEVEFGNLLSLPVSGGLLYVEPVYVRAAQTAGFPLLRKVLVTFGDTTVLRNTLDDALADVFSGSTPAPDTGGERRYRRGIRGDHRRRPGRPGPGDSSTRRTAYAQGEAALADGDFAAYGRAQADLKSALERAARRNAGSRGGGAGVAVPDGAASGSPDRPRPRRSRPDPAPAASADPAGPPGTWRGTGGAACPAGTGWAASRRPNRPRGEPSAGLLMAALGIAGPGASADRSGRPRVADSATG